MRRSRSIIFTLFSVLLLNLFTPPVSTSTTSSTREDAPEDYTQASIPQAGAIVYYEEDGKILCREATPEETQEILNRDPSLSLHEIDRRSAEVSSQTAGLRIILRGTQQLNNFPQAKQAFLRAAATWESLIANPITIIIDVDFGPTRFGNPFPVGMLGETGFQNYAGYSLYPNVRESLIAGASSSDERSLYNSLPTGSVPTELGNTTNIFGPATFFRALGILNAVADPSQETHLGPPPSIGFNSAKDFDFDPSDGIDSDKYDFEGLALHEIGHVLGFFSMVGNKEEIPTAPVGVSVWDLFRFRPGVAAGSFPSSPRVLLSGGSHIFFTGNSELELSTGRQDSVGGDGRQPHHWKDNILSGHYIGVMDPIFSLGERTPVTGHDLAALDMMGYKIARGGEEPLIRSLSASLDGDVLTLNVTAFDSQGDIKEAQVKLLDGAGQLVAETPRFPVSVGTSTEVSFLLAVTNLKSFPTVVQASLTLTDGEGQTGQAVSTDFSQADPEGPVVSNVTYNGSKLRIKGRGLGGDLQIEINGRIVASGTSVLNKKVIVKGSSTFLNLRGGPNRVRVRNGQLWSNIFIVGA
jgi:hypothetical protein